MEPISASVLCLAMAIYHEARSESVDGQWAIAEVIMNRVNDPRYPDSVCKVVKEDRGPKKHDCQFSFWCDGKSDDMKDEEAKKLAVDIASRVIGGERNLEIEATHYHTTHAEPAWAKKLELEGRIGNHVFYVGW